MISPYFSFFLGIITILIIIIPFWFAGTQVPAIGRAYSSIFCAGIT
jgi:hypothetical protein